MQGAMSSWLITLRLKPRDRHVATGAVTWPGSAGGEGEEAVGGCIEEVEDELEAF